MCWLSPAFLPDILLDPFSESSAAAEMIFSTNVCMLEFAAQALHGAVDTDECVFSLDGVG